MQFKVTLAALAIVAAAAPAAADSHAGGSAMAGDQPTRGMSEQSVAARFGEPVTKVAAVGDPPISRWEYPGFIVYFEYDRVIHAVVKRR